MGIPWYTPWVDTTGIFLRRLNSEGLQRNFIIGLSEANNYAGFPKYKHVLYVRHIVYHRVRIPFRSAHSRLGAKLLGIRVTCPQNGTAVLKLWGPTSVLLATSTPLLAVLFSEDLSIILVYTYYFVYHRYAQSGVRCSKSSALSNLSFCLD